ncbi:MAG TPA: hypothetical protein DCQ34_09970 [Chitinophagaceae bacterium]|nr:hypothetical protein [Chitinophagaceae bacterium]
MHKRIIGFLALLFFSLQTIAQSAGKLYDHPSWSHQSNIYEVNLRQYSATGKIKDFQKHLTRLRQMGVDVLWFMPITPIGIEGRKMSPSELGSYYAVRNYKAVNEEFGTLADWKAMVKKAQSMGFKVITDWVANHSAQDNHWVRTNPEFYVKDSIGKVVSPFDWTDVYKLNYQNRRLRDSMIDAMRFWVKETGIDGFRCDVAEEVPEDFWRECIAELKKIKNVYMLAEAESPKLHHVGFDATYGWSLMGMMSDVYKGSKTVAQFDSLLQHNIHRFPEDAHRMFFTSNHDENSWNGTEFEKYGDAYKTFAVFTQTMYQSIPLIYNGQEVPNKKRLKFFVKDPIEWKEFKMAPFYKTLLQLRKKNPALSADASYERLKTSHDESVFSFIREKNGRKLLVVLNLSAKPAVFSIQDPRVNGKPYNVFLYTNESVSDKQNISLEPWGYIVYDYK